MSMLRIYSEDAREIACLTDHSEMAAALRTIDVAFERWEANQPLAPAAEQEAVLAAYVADVKRLSAAYGIKSVDVVALRPDNPQREAMRAKFLDEHTHDDFEIRFFVEGSGIFYLHVDDKIYATLCTQGDLISVPAGTRHWFDMGEAPNFKCIRFFTTPEGWIGNVTGSNIARQIPNFDALIKLAA
jgi:1,2-dihydroxy-3-keto-5-methylthiopentene dioxygenase